MLECKAALQTGAQVLSVARMAKRFGADLIHSNSLKADIIAGLAGRLARIPTIWHVRDRIEADYLPAPVVRVFRSLSRTIPSCVVANSQATLTSLHLRGESLRRARVVHDGCTVLPVREGQRNCGIRIGLVGRISPWKGQHIFLQAAAALHPVYPTTRFEIIGAALFSEREYEAHLHELCRALRLEEVVEFTGFIEDVPARIAELDLVVHASTTGEPFGQVIIEAMAEQKPVVATDGGGVPEIVEDGITGILVPMGDAARMTEALTYLLANPEVAAQMGRNGRARVAAQFTIQRTARKVEAVYREVLRVPEQVESNFATANS